ncbi:MAG: hypothetical protein J5I98_07700 [Phaeodactylibacter sp.]|nr:hypothetical protein [Phaeodactylibacter sp.]
MREDRLVNKKFENQDTVNEIEPIVFVDTFKNELKHLERYYQFGFNFYPVYNGIHKDTILIKYTSGNCFVPRAYDKRYPIDNESIVILIDTSNIVGSAIGAPKPPPPPVKSNLYNSNIGRTLVNRGDFYSYPVVVKNIGGDTVDIGKSDEINLIPQIRTDEMTNWFNIDTHIKSSCSPGLRILVGPDEICITTIPILKGKTRSKMRLRLNGTQIYSNEINCYISTAELE